MTYEEAIKVLSALWAYKAPQYTEKEIREALDLAVDALKYKAEIKKYGSELGAIIGKQNEWEEYTRQQDEKSKALKEQIEKARRKE